MPSARYEEVFSVAVAFRRAGSAVLDRALIEDLEFSEYGRSAGLPAGWYLVPGLLITATLMAIL